MPASQPAPGAIVPLSRGGSRWPQTIRIRQDASVTTAEPAIAVARDQVIDRIADHPWDELEDPCPLPAWKLARNAQHGLGFYIGLAVRQEGKGTRAIRIDAELLSERTSLGQLDRNEAKIAAAITFAHEAAAARAQDADLSAVGIYPVTDEVVESNWSVQVASGEGVDPKRQTALRFTPSTSFLTNTIVDGLSLSCR